jgi:hypothetical protein
MTHGHFDVERLLEVATALREAADDAAATPGLSPEVAAVLRRVADEREAAAAVLARGA